MKAIVQSAYGDPDEVLSLQEIDRPTLGDDQVLVKVHATSVHPDIWHVVAGRPYVLRLMGAGLRKPKNPVPGTDAAGVVEAIGKDVTRFSEGDEVFGEVVEGFQWMNGGTFAEYVASNESALELKPPNITMEQAATVPTSGLIALINLDKEGQIEEGHRVLINGAGGGVGTLAVQIAKALGGTVTAVDSAEKLEMLQSLGAESVIDYRAEDFTQGDIRYDLILDIASTLTLTDARRALTPEGIYVRIGHEHFGDAGTGAWLGSLPGFFKLIAQSTYTTNLPKLDFDMDITGRLDFLRGLIAEGKITPVVARTFPLGEVREAMRYMKEGKALGRIVISLS